MTLLLLDFVITSAGYLGLASVVSGAARQAPDRVAGRETGFAWMAAGLMFVCPLLVPMALALSTWLSFYSCSWLLALSGLRHGKKGERGLAGALMVLLVPYSAVVVLAILAG